MTEERYNQMICRISELMELKTNSRLEKQIKYNELYCLYQAMATEWAARNNLKYVNHHPVKRITGDVVTYEDIYRKDAAVIKGKTFNIKALRENKKWAYSRYENNYFDCSNMDHPEFFRDKQGRAVAIIAHDYNIPESKNRMEEHAEKNLLQVSFPDIVSWYYPDRTKVVLFTKIGGL